MKQNILKIASFVLSFTIGIIPVSLFNLFPNNQQIYEMDKITLEIEKDSTVIKKKSEDIEIKLKEFVSIENGLAANFEIVNNTAQSVVYRAYLPEDEKIVFSSLPFVKINGKEVEMFRCGTGLNNYELKPGESKIFRFNNLSFFWENGKSIQIGFLLKKGFNEEYKVYWSENLPISDSIAKQLLKEKN